MSQKRAVLPADLYQYQWISDPVIGPAGTVAYVLKTIDAQKNDYFTHIRTVSLEGVDDKALTAGNKDMAPAWSPDGSMLAFLRIHEGSKQIWTISAEGGDARQLTHVKRGVDGFVWSPDGRRVAYLTQVSEDAEREALMLEEDGRQEALKGRSYTRTVPKTEGSGLWNGLYSHLFVLDLATEQMTRLTSGHFDVSQPCWSPDGSMIAFLAKKPENVSADPDLVAFNDIFTVRTEGGSMRRHTNSSLSISQFTFAPDGCSFALIGNDRIWGSGMQNRLYTVPLDNSNPAVITGDMDIQIGNFALSDMKSAAASPAPVYGSDGELYVLGTHHGTVQVYRFLPDGSYEAVTEGEQDVYQFTLSANGQSLVIAAAQTAAPGELYRLDPAAGGVRKLTDRNAEMMGQLEISIPEPFWYETEDGLSVQAWIMKPPQLQPGDKAPLILQIHGGPHAMYTGAYSHEMQSLAAQGYAIVFTNPRGSFGYGQDFAKACRGDFGGGDYRDMMQGLDEALRRFDFVDSTRLGVTGGSYGGLMTNWIVSHSDRFQAAVTQRCISNWLSFYGMSDIGISYTEGIVGGNPWDDHELLWHQSPLAHVKNIKAPLLIIHGEQDMRCPIEQADQLYVALKRLGKETMLIRYPNSNHSLLKTGKPSYRVDVLEQVNQWFSRYLEKGGAEHE
ncbi:S9 family peptidase [Paenibacillus enshidis]|uniref:S9 family peptidase n=1 Tax=Paenibacillus enshidis TaxID=1458439 RepID=A0ABV5AQ90_9BACL